MQFVGPLSCILRESSSGLSPFLDRVWDYDPGIRAMAKMVSSTMLEIHGQRLSEGSGLLQGSGLRAQGSCS